ncbi:hypothetical protein [Mucisphaera sp.]|uniref:hypothetical protein n=1 Tax=Mucisphaera sp. TaxID=2913024 RepID=UPI003D0A94BA
MTFRTTLTAAALTALLLGCNSQPEPTHAPRSLPTARPALPLGVDDGGLRDDWTTTRLIYPAGNINHPPHYLNHIGDIETDPTASRSHQENLRQAVASAKPKGWTLDQSWDVIERPAVFAYNIATLPIEMIIDRPWSFTVSPPVDQDD